jgi:hypothetical protein
MIPGVSHENNKFITKMSHKVCATSASLHGDICDYDTDYHSFRRDANNNVPRHRRYEYDEYSDRYDSSSEESREFSAKKVEEDESEKYFREEREAIIRDIEFYPSCEYDIVCASKKDTKSSLVAITNGINLFREKKFGQVTVPYYSLPVKFLEKKCRVIPNHPVSFCWHCGIVLPSRHENAICHTCVDYVEDVEFDEDEDEDDDDLDGDCSCDDDDDYACQIHRRRC